MKEKAEEEGRKELGGGTTSIYVRAEDKFQTSLRPRFVPPMEI